MGDQKGNSIRLDDGNWWVDEIGDFHSGDDIDDSFDSLFLRHLGQLKLQICPKQIVITWDIHEISSDTIAYFIARLSQNQFHSRVLLRYYYYGWAEELYHGPNAIDTASQRMILIQRFKSVGLVHPTQVKELDLFDLESASPLIRRGFEMWHSTEGQYRNASQDECCEHLPNVVIYRPDQNTGNLVFSWVGARSLSMIVHGRKWAANVIRQASRNAQGSERQDYVTQVNSAYKQVWETGEPHYSSIRTLLTLEGKEPKWLSYQRLLMRYNLHDGLPALVCLSNQNSAVNILPTDAT